MSFSGESSRTSPPKADGVSGSGHLPVVFDGIPGGIIIKGWESSNAVSSDVTFPLLMA